MYKIKILVVLVIITLISTMVFNTATIKEMYSNQILQLKGIRMESCEPKKSIAFLKTHKTGSTTMARIVEQYALANKLNIVRKKKESAYLHFTNRKFNLNSKEEFLPPMGVQIGNYKKYVYNVFSLHARYGRDVYNSFMANDSFYVTLLRDPVTQFESTFDYFNIGSIIGKRHDNISKTEKLETFLSNSSYYWRILSPAKRYRSFNNQMWDLGVDPVTCTDDVIVKEIIERLDSELNLVMVTELFDESLIVLKKMLCWQFNDILYLPRNQRSERTLLNDKLAKKITEWNSIDVKLYTYFRRRLHDHIDNYGPSFEVDLAAFRSMTAFLYEQCVAGEGTRTRKKKVKYELNNGNFTSELCVRVDSLDVCDFGNGYILQLDIESVCRDVTSHDTHLNHCLRKMMKGISDRRPTHSTLI